MNVIFPMYFGEKRGCSSAGSSSSLRKLKKCFSCYTYALEWGQQQCPCKFQLLVFLNNPIPHLFALHPENPLSNRQIISISNFICCSEMPENLFKYISSDSFICTSTSSSSLFITSLPASSNLCTTSSRHLPSQAFSHLTHITSWHWN